MTHDEDRQELVNLLEASQHLVEQGAKQNPVATKVEVVLTEEEVVRNAFLALRD